jgi:hypothetical protein
VALRIAGAAFAQNVGIQDLGHQDVGELWLAVNHKSSTSLNFTGWARECLASVGNKALTSRIPPMYTRYEARSQVHAGFIAL